MAYAKSIFKMDPCYSRMDMGEAGIDVIIRDLDSWVDFKPSQAYPGTIEYETHVADPACDVYVYTRPPLPEAEEGEEQWEHGQRIRDAMRSCNPPGTDSWFMIAFNAKPGPGAEMVKTIVNGRKVRASLVRLTDGAFLKSTMLDGEGQPRWYTYDKGERKDVSPGEAATLGLEGKATESVEVVVSPHIAVLSFLVEQGIAKRDARLIDNATAADVQGKHVAGSLPVDIAGSAKSVTTLRLARPLPAIGAVTVEDVRERFLGFSRFSVSGR